MSAPAPRELKRVDDDSAPEVAARALAEDLKRDVIDHLRNPLLVVTAVMGLFFLSEWHRAVLAPPQVVQAFNWVLLCVVVRTRAIPLPAKKVLFVTALAINPVCALLHYGALMGTGVFASTSVLGATFFFERRGAVLMWSWLMGAFVAVAVLSLNGVIAPEHVPLTTREWFRIGLAASVALATVAYFFSLVIGAIARSFGNLVVERREKESAQLSAQRLESLGRLAGGIAHELNNALQVVQSGVGVLRSQVTAEPQQPPVEPLSPEEAARITGDITRAVDAAAATAHRLLAFGRARPEDAGRSSPAEVVAAFAKTARRSLPAAIRLADDIDVPTGAADIRAIADIPIAPAALDEVLSNLVANAVDAMPEGGVIWLRVTQERDDVVITVGDSGPGVAADVVDHVFDPFFTNRTGRNGLGLAAVWGIVTRVGGRIAYVAAPGEGARFEIRFAKLPPLPAQQRPSPQPAPALAPAPAQVPTPAPAPQVAATAGKPRLLLVEDEADVARIFVRVLSRAGYDVTAFERVAPALDAMTSSSFDVLMTDVVVPGGGVPGLIETFKSRCSPYVLVCSGHVEEDLVSHGIARGEYRFLRKPFAGPELVAALSDLLPQA